MSWIKCFLLVLLISTTVLYAQNEDPYGRDIEELTLKKRGPNKDKYSHLFIGYGFLLGEAESDSAQIINGKSSTFTIGYLLKWRLANWYELGFDIAYKYQSFNLVQDSTKLIPNNELHKKEKIVFNALDVAPFQRFKFRNKDHSTGIFLDLGGYFSYHYRIKHQTTSKDRVFKAGKTKTENTELDYTEKYAYGVMGRIGFNRFIFYGRYRLSDLFTEKSGFPELPRINVGLKIGIHQ